MKIFFTIAAILLMQTAAVAQLYVGPQSTLYIQPGNTLQVDSLIFIPTATLTISNNKIEKTRLAQATPTGMTINQVYLVDTPLLFKGTAGIYYSGNTLNGNAVNSLAIVVADTLTDTFRNVSSVSNLPQSLVSAGFSSVVRIGKISAGSSGTPLPIQLLSFDAWPDGENVKLNWVTASEVNASAYIIERSADGQQFSPLLLLNAKGNPSAPGNYTTYDEQPLVPNNYYRLLSRDISGKVSYHGIRKVHFNRSNSGLQLSAWPVPADNILYLSFSAIPDKEASLAIFNLTGKIVQHLSCNTQRFSISLDQLASGIYLLRYRGNDGQQTIRIEKR